MHPVHAAQNELPRRVVDDLARHGVELEFGDEAFDHHRVERQEIEEQRAVRRGSEGDEVSAILRINPLMDVSQVRRLPAKRGTVVDDFKLNLATRVIDDRHTNLLDRVGILS